jgi:hypothetical protein
VAYYAKWDQSGDYSSNSAVMPDFCSDHCYSILETNFRSLRENLYTQTILDYNNAEYESIKTHLDLIKWHERLDDLNEMLSTTLLMMEFHFA